MIKPQNTINKKYKKTLQIQQCDNKTITKHKKICKLKAKNRTALMLNGKRRSLPHITCSLLMCHRMCYATTDIQQVDNWHDINVTK